MIATVPVIEAIPPQSVRLKHNHFKDPDFFEMELEETIMSAKTHFSFCLPVAACIAMLWPCGGLNGQQVDTPLKVNRSSPHITIETSSPPETSVGEKTRFVITIRNLGQTKAEGVNIQTEIPANVRLLSTDPEPKVVVAGKSIQFEVGDVVAGGVKKIELELVPNVAGPIDVQTKAFFSSTTQSAMQVRKPEIEVQCIAPETVVRGHEVEFRVLVSNVGDGTAHDLVVTPSLLPAKLAGSDRDSKPQKVAAVSAGTATEVVFKTRAIGAESMQPSFVVTGPGIDGKLTCEGTTKIVEPTLKIRMKGPRVTRIDREDAYQIFISNSGDTPVKSAEIVLQIPDGMSVTRINTAAEYNHSTRTLTWRVPRIEAGSTDARMFKAAIVRPGSQVQRIMVTTSDGMSDRTDHSTRAIARADVDVAVTNTQEAIEVGTAEEFTVWLKNRGSIIADSVAVKISLPDALHAVKSARYSINGQTIIFQSIALDPGEERILRFQAAGRLRGNHAVRATMQTGSSAVKAIAETTVFIFDDTEVDVAKQEPARIPIR